jgi:cobalt-zinc-cadmium efflux system protein
MDHRNETSINEDQNNKHEGVGYQNDCGLDHSHCQSGHQHYVNVEDTSGSRLLITLFLNLIIPVVQVIGGMYAHSMALISDAAHNFSDFTAVLIAYVANRIGKRGASARNTFGYRRTEILAAVINVALLLSAATFIVYEAIHRLQHPEAVIGQLVVLVAGIGVLGNGLSAWLLHKDASHNLNVKGAFLHMLGDLLTSVVVVINGIVLIFKPWYWLDPILSVLIALFILKNCWVILKEATCILMNATPNGLDIEKIKDFLERILQYCLFLPHCGTRPAA